MYSVWKERHHFLEVEESGYGNSLCLFGGLSRILLSLGYRL